MVEGKREGSQVGKKRLDFKMGLEKFKFPKKQRSCVVLGEIGP